MTLLDKILHSHKTIIALRHSKLQHTLVGLVSVVWSLLSVLLLFIINIIVLLCYFYLSKHHSLKRFPKVGPNVLTKVPRYDMDNGL